MSSIILFLFFIPFLALVLLAINLIFAPHNPYQEKDSVFECGFHSFIGQNRTQFSISFFIFALLFLLFDLEILLVYPYIVSAYINSIYGLIIMLVFFLVLTLGFAYELGKKALRIESKQYTIFLSSLNPPRPHAFDSLQSKWFNLNITEYFKLHWRAILGGLVIAYLVTLPLKFLFLQLDLRLLASIFAGILASLTYIVRYNLMEIKDPYVISKLKVSFIIVTVTLFTYYISYLFNLVNSTIIVLLSEFSVINFILIELAVSLFPENFACMGGYQDIKPINKSVSYDPKESLILKMNNPNAEDSDAESFNEGSNEYSSLGNKLHNIDAKRDRSLSLLNMQMPDYIKNNSSVSTNRVSKVRSWLNSLAYIFRDNSIIVKHRSILDRLADIHIDNDPDSEIVVAINTLMENIEYNTCIGSKKEYEWIRKGNIHQLHALSIELAKQMSDLEQIKKKPFKSLIEYEYLRNREAEVQQLKEKRKHVKTVSSILFLVDLSLKASDQLNWARPDANQKK